MAGEVGRRGRVRSQRDVGSPRGGQAPHPTPSKLLLAPASEAWGRPGPSGSLLGGGGGQLSPPAPSAGFSPSGLRPLGSRQQPWRLLCSEELTLIRGLTKGQRGPWGDASAGIRWGGLPGVPQPRRHHGCLGPEGSVAGLVSGVAGPWIPADPPSPAGCEHQGSCRHCHGAGDKQHSPSPQFRNFVDRCPGLRTRPPAGLPPSRPSGRLRVLEGKGVGGLHAKSRALVRPLDRGDSERLYWGEDS